MESRGAPRTGPAGRLDRVRFIPRCAGAIGRALRRSSGSQARPLGLIGPTTAFWRGVREAIDKSDDQGPVCLIMIRSGHHVGADMKRPSQAPCEGGEQELPLLRLERKRFCHLYLLTETLQFVVTLRDFSTRVRIIGCATVLGWWLRSRRHVRICLDGQISQGTHGPTCSAAIAAVK